VISETKIEKIRKRLLSSILHRIVLHPELLAGFSLSRTMEILKFIQETYGVLNEYCLVLIHTVLRHPGSLELITYAQSRAEGGFLNIGSIGNCHTSPHPPLHSI